MMTTEVACLDFSVNVDRRTGPQFVCALHAAGRVPNWVHLAGDLDSEGPRQLERALRQTDMRCPVILDLRGLSSLDSSGVAVISDASARARQANRWLILIRGSAEIDRRLALSGAAEALNIIDVNPRGQEAPGVVIRNAVMTTGRRAYSPFQPSGDTAS